MMVRSTGIHGNALGSSSSEMATVCHRHETTDSSTDHMSRDIRCARFISITAVRFIIFYQLVSSMAVSFVPFIYNCAFLDTPHGDGQGSTRYSSRSSLRTWTMSGLWRA
jgi:hypothetical protein